MMPLCSEYFKNDVPIRKPLITKNMSTPCGKGILVKTEQLPFNKCEPCACTTHNMAKARKKSKPKIRFFSISIPNIILQKVQKYIFSFIYYIRHEKIFCGSLC